MNNGRYVDKDTIIKRVSQYYGLDASGKDINDFIYDGLRGVGKRAMFDLIATTGENGMPQPIDVSEYRGILPTNIEAPLFALDYDTNEPLRCINSVFNETHMLHTAASKTYSLKRNFIFTSEKTQKIVLVYLGFPLNSIGEPLIPDDENYLKAITAYVAMSIARPLVIRGKLNHQIFSMIEQDYFAYANSTDVMEMPNEDEMEQLKNNLLTLLPDYNKYSHNFSDLGLPTNIKYT